MIDSKTTRRMIYHGRVQGVGFRAGAERIARKFAVTGYVQNLPDGTVELVARGLAAEIDPFLAAVAERFDGCIERADELPPPEGFAAKAFTVLY